MPSSGTVALLAIWAMLDACAPGHTRRQRVHNWLIRWGDRAYPRLPVGEHGRRQNPEIEVGHVKQMVRLFGIEECAKRFLERLR
ncbi:MAG: hypothetical protein HY905_02945 [Deltaproteobacteria bacterium]|nr:hypothetical protein [Deltaproteobacteria bacterium]